MAPPTGRHVIPGRPVDPPGGGGPSPAHRPPWPPQGRPAGARPEDATPDESGDAAREDAARVDAALVLASRTDPEAFGILYDRYAERIHRYVLRRLSDREAAQDVTAEVFFKALRALDSYRPETAPFSAWLYRIAANAVVDHVRARRVTSTLEAVEQTADPSARVEDEAIERMEVDRVWSAVDRLNLAQRTAVVLRLGHELPIAEIAVRMSRSEGAVKLLLNRGLRSVRGWLETPGEPPDAAPAVGPTGDEEARP